MTSIHVQAGLSTWTPISCTLLTSFVHDVEALSYIRPAAGIILIHLALFLLYTITTLRYSKSSLRGEIFYLRNNGHTSFAHFWRFTILSRHVSSQFLIRLCLLFLCINCRFIQLATTCCCLSETRMCGWFLDKRLSVDFGLDSGRHSCLVRYISCTRTFSAIVTLDVIKVHHF